ncbi:DUF4192 domain-containing protein [Actinoplanes sp. LDG1-06]|uniref:DUF4192 domain-containing protein n=1 Tax=Paractinoplanes ovalisporus TaxID=2810368 RepID=A0ABS2AAT4_9ACTN|nr:DUF4192 domain-containing protein [Actinoplanes ovalisporus]MBM2616945.1 DUF4192 domain-containing protein [Actinoplanes ovalisporus]
MALGADARAATLPGMNPECTITVRSSADLIAVTPYLLGFHPTDSVVVIGTAGPVVSFVARHDLLRPDDDGDDSIAPLVAAQEVEAVTILGYGRPGPVGRTVETLAAGLTRSGVPIREKLRITDGRWWRFGCTDSACCPPSGNPVPTHGSVAAAAVYQGQVALPSREALIAQVAAVEGELRARTSAATTRICRRYALLFSVNPHPELVLLRAGRLLVIKAETTYASGRSLTAEEIAHLGVVLTSPVVLDEAINRTRDEPWRIALWTEVTRGVDPFWVPGPACLLSHAAWRQGLGALARVAIDRALRQDPGHRMACTLDRLLAAGISHDTVADLAPPRSVTR